MNIALCTDSFPPVMGGTEFVVDVLARKLSSKLHGSHNVAVFTQDFCHKNINDSDLPYKVYRTKGVKIPFVEEFTCYPKLDNNFIEAFINFKPDVVHIHTVDVIGNWAVEMAKSIKVKSILTVHTRYVYAYDLFTPFSEDNFVHQKIVEMLKTKNIEIVKNADVVTTVSDSSLHEELQKSYGIDREVAIIRNGFDSPVVKIDSDYYLKNNERNKFLISFSGRVNKTKNLNFSLQVILELVNRNIPVVFYIAGEGAAKRHYVKCLEEYGIREHVVWLGRLKQDDLFKLHSKCDLFLFPSIFDNDSIAAMEARFCGCPTMAIKDTGTAERIVEGVNGYTVNYELDEFVSKIIELYNMKQSNFEEYIKIRKSTSELIPKNWDEVTNEYLELYKGNS